jgi:7tm Chemosensory receptor
MPFSKAETIFETARPLYLVSKLFGLTAFGIEECEGEWKAKVTKWNFLHLIFTTIYFTYVIVVFVLNYDKIYAIKVYEYMMMSQVTKVSVLIICIIFFIAVNFETWITFITHKYIINSINLIAKVDREFSKMAIFINHRKHKRILVINLIIVESVLFLTSCASGYHYYFLNKIKSNILVLGSSFVALSIVINFDLQFMLIMWSIKSRYRKLNRFLYETFDTPLCTSNAAKKTILNETAKLHDILVDASENVSVGYGYAVSLSNCMQFK